MFTRNYLTVLLIGLAAMSIIHSFAEAAAQLPVQLPASENGSLSYFAIKPEVRTDDAVVIDKEAPMRKVNVPVELDIVSDTNSETMSSNSTIKPMQIVKVVSVKEEVGELSDRAGKAFKAKTTVVFLSNSTSSSTGTYRPIKSSASNLTGSLNTVMVLSFLTGSALFMMNKQSLF